MTKILAVLIASIAISMAVTPAEMKAEVHEKRGKSLPYRWTKTGDSKKPALVLFLHGAGERGDNNKSQLVHGVKDLLKWLETNKESAVVVAPQCNRGTWWADLSGNFKDPKDGTLSKKPSDMLSMVFEVVDKLAKKHKVDPNRIYVTGLSMGGFGTFGSVAHRPDFFAAAMPVCGGGDAKTAAKMAQVPFWVFHGDADKVVPVACSRVMAKALKDAGAEVKLTEYPGVGHDSWTQTYRSPQTWKWLFSQKKN
ncbi:prolyl oligopeptidase family serine peptidase [bacterium]|nr:prolyl oligopeptidase family serine peptidase [bacterium]MDB4454825.1 prolyl oligopeptidase family serine peptidase [bacterium]MDC0550061.1 prolyl oligopeptidase family serine peptidase [bacterium]